MAKKISFLFGAGAEGENNYNLPNGYEYMRKSLYDEEQKKGYTNALKQYFKGTYFSEYKYSKHTMTSTDNTLKLLLSAKINSNPSFYYQHKSDIKSIFNDKQLRRLIGVSNTNDRKGCSKESKTSKNNSTRKEINQEFSKIVKGDITEYSNINSCLLKDLFSSKKHSRIISGKKAKTSIDIDFDLHIGKLLDSYFHTIIDPMRYGTDSFSRILNYYWSCYFTIIGGILNLFSDNESFSIYIKDKKPNYDKIINNIQDFTKLLYDAEIPYKSSYYTEIKKKLDEKGFDNVGVITTNYYKLCSIVNEDVIYLNGQLRWFEFPETISVEDFYHGDPDLDNRLFFPFVFGQSLVKPIVHSKQIEEYHKLHDTLEKSECLIVLGHSMNPDDNHINSFIREYMESGGSMIVVGSDDENSQKENIITKLRMSNTYTGDRIYPIQVNYTNDSPAAIVDKIFRKIDEL